MLPLFRRGSNCNRGMAGLAAILLTSTGISTPALAGGTGSPIEHVVVIVGENWSFDSLFATYVPPAGQTVSNLLSKGIITAEGTPGETVQGRFEGASEILADDNLEDSLHDVAAAQHGWSPFRRER